MNRAEYLADVRFPAGWVADSDPFPVPAFVNAELGLWLVVDHPALENRKCLAPRFQLFDMVDHEPIRTVIRSEHWHEILGAIAARRRAA
jgi:hypothetical protein